MSEIRSSTYVPFYCSTVSAVSDPMLTYWTSFRLQHEGISSHKAIRSGRWAKDKIASKLSGISLKHKRCGSSLLCNPRRPGLTSDI